MHSKTLTTLAVVSVGFCLLVCCVLACAGQSGIPSLMHSGLSVAGVAYADEADLSTRATDELGLDTTKDSEETAREGVKSPLADSSDSASKTSSTAADVPVAAGKALTAAPALTNADTLISVSADIDAALLKNASFGIDSFSRQNKGTNRGYNDEYFGYRYAMPAQQSFSAIIAQGYTLIYIAPELLDSLGLDITSEDFQVKFLTTLDALDRASAHGGPEFDDFSGQSVYFTSEDKVVVGDFTYCFGVEVEPGYYYATVTKTDSEDGSEGGVYAESGILQTAENTIVVEKASGLAALQGFFSELDWSPLWVSLKTTGVAILIIFVLGLLAAWGTLRVSNRWKGILDTIFTIPMVLPPTVCGFLLLLLFGTSTAAGRWLIDHGIDIVFTWPAAVIACTVVAFPLLYRTARGAFENLDSAMLDAARTLGWSETRIFFRLMLPLAWPSIAAGTVLGFARAMGEFGCTLFFAGNYAGITQTIPIAIYFDWMGGKTDVALFWVLVVIAVSFLVILFINIYSSRTQRYRKRPKDA